MKRRVAVLGSTGSIGVQTLDVLASLGNGFEAVSLAARSNWERLAEQCRRHRPALAALEDPAAAQRLREALGPSSRVRVLEGRSGICELVSAGGCDLAVAAIVGRAGLEAVLGALAAGIPVALANKEALVVAGPLMRRAARDGGTRILPVDSEHCAIDQALRAGRPGELARILLTTSGGPLRDRPIESLSAVTPAEALRHPTWSMGPKITVDSATLMNKALEVIEAKHLFDVAPDRIDVLVHPQSVVHSAVEFLDGSVVAQMSPPDMRGPIQYALTYPERVPSRVARLDLAALGSLTFRAPDPARYPALGLGYRAARAGGTAEAVLNAANEVAVDSFLAGRLPFPRIAALCAEVLDAHAVVPDPNLEQVLAADEWAREHARSAAVAVRRAGA